MNKRSQKMTSTIHLMSYFIFQTKQVQFRLAREYYDSNETKRNDFIEYKQNNHFYIGKF